MHDIASRSLLNKYSSITSNVYGTHYATFSWRYFNTHIGSQPNATNYCESFEVIPADRQCFYLRSDTSRPHKQPSLSPSSLVFPHDNNLSTNRLAGEAELLTPSEENEDITGGAVPCEPEARHLSCETQVLTPESLVVAVGAGQWACKINISDQKLVLPTLLPCWG